MFMHVAHYLRLELISVTSFILLYTLPDVYGIQFASVAQNVHSTFVSVAFN